MTSQRSISVVIPSYNSARWVGEAVESVLAQTLRPAQIIVVDDGSKDDTAQVLRQYVDAGAIEYVLQENRGVAAARNTGIARATGDLIAFLDADDVWHPRKLELQSGVLDQRPELGLLGTAVFGWPSGAPLGSDVLGAAQVNDVAWERLIVRNYFTTSSVIVRRSAIEGTDGPPFDVQLHGPEDYDLWLRTAESSKVANLDCPLTGYREVAGSLGKQAQTMEAGVGRILRKATDRGTWNRQKGRSLRRKAYAYFYYTCGYMHGTEGSHVAAIRRVLKSMLTYPLPLAEVRSSFERPKFLAITLLRLLGLREEGPCAVGDHPREPK